MHIVVIGGGAAGVGAAHAARKQGAHVTLIESNDAIGGRGRTFFWEGAWRVWGAAAYVGGEPQMKALAKELGIYDESQIIEVPEEAEFATLHPRLGLTEVSLDPLQMLRCRAIPWVERLSLIGAAIRLLRYRPSALSRHSDRILELDNISACDFLRKYSPALADYVIEPIMQQYFGYDADDYTMAWLVRTANDSLGSKEMPWRFKARGVGEVFAAIQSRWEGDPAMSLMLGTRATSVSWSNTGVMVETDAGNVPGPTIQADALVIAAPPPRVLPILHQLNGEHRRLLEKIEYVSHHVMHFLVERPAEKLPVSLLLPTAMGFLCVSNVWVHDHDSKHLYLHAEMKGAYGAAHARDSDDELLDAAWVDIVRALPSLRGRRTTSRILLRNEIGLCRRERGHQQTQASLLKLFINPRVAFSGDYLGNSTLGMSYATGEAAATQILSRLLG